MDDPKDGVIMIRELTYFLLFVIWFLSMRKTGFSESLRE